jgi:hypothetical protein
LSFFDTSASYHSVLVSHYGVRVTGLPGGKAARTSYAPPFLSNSCNGLKPARTSSEKIFGCSHAAGGITSGLPTTHPELMLASQNPDCETPGVADKLIKI